MNKLDYKILLDVIESAINEEKYDLAFDGLNSNYDYLLNNDFNRFTKLYLKCLVFKNEILKTNEFLEKIENLPYLNQEREEFIKSLYQYVDLLNKENNKNIKNIKEDEEAHYLFNPNKYYRPLYQDDIVQVSILLKDLGEKVKQNYNNSQNIESIRLNIEKAFEARINFDFIKSLIFVFILTHELNIDKLFFKNKDRYYLIKINDYRPKYEAYLFLISKYLNIVLQDEKNVTVSDLFNNLFVPYLMSNLPEIFDENKIKEVFIASIVASYKLLNADYKEDNILKSYQFDLNKIQELSEDILSFN